MTYASIVILLFYSVLDVSANNGDQIISLVDEHEDGYANLISNVTMILENADGRQRERSLMISALEKVPLGDFRKFVFKKPADVKGTSVLIHSNVTEDDDQWIYLPAFKRVKRISSSNKTTPFVGSEFTYEDLSSQEKEKYHNRWLGTEVVDELVCDVVERIPIFRKSAYSKVIAYVDQFHRRYRKIEYFDKNNVLVKTQHLTDYQTYKGRYQLPNKTVMVNHSNGKKTAMLWSDIQLGTELSEKHFTVSFLKNSR